MINNFDSKNIIVFGSRKITIDIIEYILSSTNHKIVYVSECDAERDRVYGSELVGEYCLKKRIVCGNSESIIDCSLMRPDIIFSAYYRKILKRDLLLVANMGCINIHPAFLPQYRGPAPSLWNILKGEITAGSTIHYMVENIDAGDIIDQKKLEIGDRTGFELNRDLMNLGFELFVDNFNDIMCGISNRSPQDNDKATYCLPFCNNMRYMVWGASKDVRQQVRAFAPPYEGAITYTLGGMFVIINNVEIMDKRLSMKPPGSYFIKDNVIYIETCDKTVVSYNWKHDRGIIKHSGRFVSGPPHI